MLKVASNGTDCKAQPLQNTGARDDNQDTKFLRL